MGRNTWFKRDECMNFIIFNIKLIIKCSHSSKLPMRDSSSHSSGISSSPKCPSENSSNATPLACGVSSGSMMPEKWLRSASRPVSLEPRLTTMRLSDSPVSLARLDDLRVVALEANLTTHCCRPLARFTQRCQWIYQTNKIKVERSRPSPVVEISLA